MAKIYMLTMSDYKGHCGTYKIPEHIVKWYDSCMAAGNIDPAIDTIPEEIINDLEVNLIDIEEGIPIKDMMLDYEILALDKYWVQNINDIVSSMQPGDEIVELHGRFV